ncbi:MAG: MBL fold metallo-hydrolase, partial [Bacteroidia bacterium]
VVLGVAQDAGFPQADCYKYCCRSIQNHPNKAQSVVSLGIVDADTDESWLIDATPDFPAQKHLLHDLSPQAQFSGIFLTHAHIGHYTGLMYLGREAMGASQVPVYSLPRMASFLTNNGPWDQLIKLKNINMRPLKVDSLITLSNNFSIKPIQVPHRDEYSETAGYQIIGPKKKILFIPDIDKWEKWDRDIRLLIKEVDIALLDGSFFQNGELPNRDMSEIPHPFVEESMAYFSDLPSEEKAKIHFIHFNHTNPLLNPESEATKRVEEAGFKVARQGLRWSL